MTKFAASTSDEEFPGETWDTIEEAIEAQNKELEDGERFFVAEVHPLSFRDFFLYDNFIENLQEEAENWAGEASEGYLEDMKPEDEESLIAHIEQWFIDHGQAPGFWAADNVKEFTSKK